MRSKMHSLFSATKLTFEWVYISRYKAKSIEVFFITHLHYFTLQYKEKMDCND